MAVNRNDLFSVIGDISDDLVLEASNPVVKIRRIQMTKVIALIAAIIMLFGISVFAATVIYGGISGHSSKIPTYYSVPSRQKLGYDIGIQFNVIDVFSNGYHFKSGHIVHNNLHDMNGYVTEKFKGLHCKYQSDSNVISFYAEAPNAYSETDNLETTETYKDADLKYYFYLNKIVPGNYELSEQDKKDKESGKYVFSFGSQNIELHEVQGIKWEYNGIEYSFCAIDVSITKDELIQMAKEVIDYQD